MSNFIRCFAFLVTLPVSALAIWSSFAHVTPDTRAKYDLNVCVASIKDEPDLKRVRFLLKEKRYQDAWLITTNSYEGPDSQKFREYLWQENASDSGIELISKIENQRSDMAGLNSDDNREYAEVRMSRAMMGRSYIYIDFQEQVFDGGYYYSIDLSTFINIEDEC